MFILLFANFEKADEYLKEILTDKQATKLMAESGNVFENFIDNFYVKFGKLQIKGFHGKGQTFHPKPAVLHRTVDPRKRHQNLHRPDSVAKKVAPEGKQA